MKLTSVRRQASQTPRNARPTVSAVRTLTMLTEDVTASTVVVKAGIIARVSVNAWFKATSRSVMGTLLGLPLIGDVYRCYM